MVKDDLFFETFQGEAVQILTKMESTIMEDDIPHKAPIAIEGFLLDHDKKYYYLGKTPYEVSYAIKIAMVSHVEIKPTEEEQLLLDLKPNRDEDIN